MRGKGRATGYTDFYKQTSNPSKSNTKIGSRMGSADDEEENEDPRKAAIKRRLAARKAM